MIYTSEITMKSKKGMSNEVRDLYKTRELLLSKYYLTYGTTFGNLLYDINGSVCIEKDIALGIANAGWANDLLITGLQYVASTTHQYGIKIVHDFKYARDIARGAKSPRKPSGDVTYLDLQMPLICLYSRTDINVLLRQKLAKYHKLGGDTFIPEFFEDPKEFIGEYYIKDIADTPEPEIIMISSPTGSVKRPQVEYSKLGVKLDNLQTKFPRADIIYYKNLNLQATKTKTNSTGTTSGSFVGLKVIDDLIQRYSLS